MKRVGHGGASALVRANTLESFDAALAIGVDMIEFDVRGNGRGELVLAHTRLDLRRPGCPRLDDALLHLSAPQFDEVALNLDLKTPRCEAAVVDSIERFGLHDRVLVSSQVPSLLDRVRELDARVMTGISVGGRASRWCRRWGDWREAVLEAIAAGRFSSLMAQHGLIDPHLIQAVKDRGAEIYAWTVNDHRAITRLAALGVDGVVTSDPRLFTLASLD
ncbi:MAG TPA: glycerophosphodiester phosphodiesterase [Thermoleophilaceae bacterium]|jgi:glycerophosphoryl diester phosphodiesterase|nr:glycerophosphodiester phosphodiesterase [Thermoleophilaceae bacterium]